MCATIIIASRHELELLGPVHVDRVESAIPEWPVEHAILFGAGSDHAAIAYPPKIFNKLVADGAETGRDLVRLISSDQHQSLASFTSLVVSHQHAEVFAVRRDLDVGD